MDSKIIELFFSRSEQALSELSAKYERLCRKIAYGILKNNEDTEECLNTSYMCLWNSIPPAKPDSLCAYLCSVVRNNAFAIYSKSKYRFCEDSFEELAEIITDGMTVESLADGTYISSLLNDFLAGTDSKNRKIFMCRYYFNMSVSEIAHKVSMSESAVKTRLSRLRQKLRSYLSERGVNV
ncbi:MAG: sigma-70 family RNA polymerase sigma factor [Ruminiclostridium sp.]|nr:sigma-70 family RNA polymerase sigma factor [Ruminiclostridium sp.]